MWDIDFDAIEDELAKKFFQEHIKKLPQIPKEPFKREEILDPSKPLPLKRRIVMYINEKDLAKQEEYDNRPDVMTFQKYYPQPERNNMLIRYVKDPECQHLPILDRIKYGYDKIYHAFQVANPDYVLASNKITSEVHKSLFGTDEELMREMHQIYHENPEVVLPMIKGELKGEDYWAKIYEIHVSMCKRKGIPPLKIPEVIHEPKSKVLYKISSSLIDELEDLMNQGGEEDRSVGNELPEVWEDWDEYFNGKRDPFTGGSVNFYEGLKFVHNPYKSDYNTTEKEPEEEMDWEAMREKMDRDLKEWLEKQEAKKKEIEEKKKKEEEEKAKKEKQKEIEEVEAWMRKAIAAKINPKTGKPEFMCTYYVEPDSD